MMFTNRKNMDLRPIMANIFEKKTIYGSFVTAKIAGIESTAKMRSVNSTIKSTRNKGVINLFPSIFMKKFLPSYLG